MADDKQQLDTTPPDPSPYIRTMAKDVARLTGTATPSITTKKGKDAPQAGVLLPEVDESPIQHKDPIAKEYKPEVLETSKEDDKEVFAQKQKGASFFSSIPQAPIAVTPSVPQPTADERQRILEKLKAEAQNNQQAPAPAPAPSEPSLQTLMSQITGAPGLPPLSKDPIKPVPPPVPESVYVPAPPPPKVAPVPPPPPPPPPAPAPVVPPPPPPPPAPPQDPATIPAPSNLHTYKTDFADRIDQQQASTFSVLAAASDAGQLPAAPAAPKRSLLPIIGGVVLVIAGIGSAAGALWYLATRPQVAFVPEVPSLVIPDETIELSGTGFEMYAKLASLAEDASVDGNVYVTYVSTTTPTQKGVTKTPLQGGYLIAQLPLHAPTILLRNLDPKSTAGLIDTGSETRPFFIFRVTSYERSFAGMLAWESTIAEDLKALYPAIVDPAPVVATTTATSTRPVRTVATTTPAAVTPPRFVDTIVSNHDVRALKDSKGRTILLYGYRDKSTLIIARNEDAFSALITRLTATPQ